MTERKFKSYTLWMKWRYQGWRPAITCLNLPWPAANPRKVLEEWIKSQTHCGHRVRGKTWMILPEHRMPKQLRGIK